MEEEIRKVLVDLIAFVKSASPEVWAILLRQQIVLGTMALVGWLVNIICLVICLCKYKKVNWEYLTAESISILVFAIALIFTSMFLVAYLPRLLNPAYYALMALKP